MKQIALNVLPHMDLDLFPEWRQVIAVPTNVFRIYGSVSPDL